MLLTADSYLQVDALAGLMAALTGSVDTLMSEVIGMEGEVTALLAAYQSAYGEAARSVIEEKLQSLKSAWSELLTQRS